MQQPATMITAAEAARRLGKAPETIRRWIRGGKLPATKVGRLHMIEEADLHLPTEKASYLPAPRRRTATGEEMPDVVAAARRAGC